jgi:hypothetical protein
MLTVSTKRQPGTAVAQKCRDAGGRGSCWAILVDRLCVAMDRRLLSAGLLVLVLFGLRFSLLIFSLPVPGSKQATSGLCLGKRGNRCRAFS